MIYMTIFEEDIITKIEPRFKETINVLIMEIYNYVNYHV